MPTVTYHGTQQDLRQLLTSFIAAMSTDGGDFAPYVRGIKLRVGMVALACVQEAFVAKASGGAGEDGITWAPLTKETIAARPLGSGDKKLMKGYGAQNGYDVLGRIKRGFLTPAQDKRWRQIFGTRKAQFMARHGMSEEAAAGRAAEIAWATLKAEGAKTKLDVLGSRHVLIGRSTGRLLASLSPGFRNAKEATEYPLLSEPPPILNPAEETEENDRILREEAGAVIVGSNVEYAAPFHRKRPLWPDGDLPPAWAERISEAARSGIAEAIEMILRDQPTRRVA